MGNNNSNNKIIQHFSIINKQRWIIRKELFKLGYEDNYELQYIYIEENLRQKYIKKYNF